MSTPAYRMSMTAADIERLLLSISDKLTVANIIHDYTAGGGDKDIIAAEAVKNMWLKLNEMVTGQGLVDAINAAPNSNSFTDAYKARLDQDSYKFIGSPNDTLERDDIDTTNFTGGELILLQKNASGNPEMQYWKRTAHIDSEPTYAWASISSSGSEDANITFPTAGTQLLKRIPKSLFHMVEFRIHGIVTNGNWQSVDGKVGYVGNDLYYTLSDELKTLNVLGYNFTMDDDYFYINITTVQANTKCYLGIIRGY